MPAAPDAESASTEVERLRTERDQLMRRVGELQTQHVREWLDLIKSGTVVPLHVANSFSWRVTRPLRLAGTAMTLLRREGAGTVWAAVLERLRRLTGRRTR